MDVWFRCDANARIGSGHLRRCLTLADALRGAGSRCTFMGVDEAGGSAGLARARGHRWHTLAPAGPPAQGRATGWPTPIHAGWLEHGWESDLASSLGTMRDAQVDWLVVDHYAIDAQWEGAMRMRVGRIMVIDDLADRRHDCDMLLDANFGRQAKDYAALVPAHCRVLAGSEFVLLRPEFIAARARTPRRRPSRVSNILVAMGGTDPDNTTGRVLSVLDAIPGMYNVRVSVVVGADAPHAGQVRQRAAACRYPVTVWQGVDDIAQKMAESDLAIGSGGTSAYERLYVRLPSLVTSIAPNQAAHLARMAESGLFRTFEDDAALRQLVEQALAAAPPLPPDVVGCGVPALVRALSVAGVVLAHPCADDIRRTFRWLADPVLRRDFLLRDVPTRRGHFRYWRTRLASTAEQVFSVYYDGRHIGNAGIRNVDPASASGELWLYLGDPADRGKGLGRSTLAAIEQAMRGPLGLHVAFLHVAAGNAAASALYRRSGYVKVSGSPLVAKFNEPVMRMEKRL